MVKSVLHSVAGERTRRSRSRRDVAAERACRVHIRRGICSVKYFLAAILFCATFSAALGQTEIQFENPPAADRPWVYWFWKNGNISREGITADLEAMDRVGIGGVILMEVALSVPPGKYTFFSDEWRGMFKHAVMEADRLGMVVSMNSAPGWTGSGGPWVTPAQSMQKVVFSETTVTGPTRVSIQLPQPDAVLEYYQDIAVLAFPTLTREFRLGDIAEKALYKRGAFSSQPAVRASLPAVAKYGDAPPGSTIAIDQIINVSAHMAQDGLLTWEAPAGNWTILRIGHTSTGQTNRPAPLPGLECDKLDPKALDSHFHAFIDTLLGDIGPEAKDALVAVHLDSWEVGAQNWTRSFREEFTQRRGYDPLPYLPAMTGRVVQSVEISERFLWDLRQTVSDLIVENHGRHLRGLAHEQGLWFSVEPYDMTPCDDMTLGATGDVPMCEFWSKGFDTRYSVKEATSVAHVYDKPIVAAEAFTSIDRWLFHPGTIKAQGDWAFCEGVNRFVIHRYVHQPYSNIRPGLSLGPHGLHYERTQTWWEFSRPWHEYLTRCQHVLRQGRFVSDILYLSPEGAPNVFQSPDPAPRGYKYDACTPQALGKAATNSREMAQLFGEDRYRLLVLPVTETMTPELLSQVRDVAEHGVPVIGVPPHKSPSLTNYPKCDERVQLIADTLWNTRDEKLRVVLPRMPGNGATPAEDRRGALARAHWIWHRETDTAAPPPPGKRYFRRVVSLPEDAAIRSARVIITADNAFSLYVNGTFAVDGENLNELFAADVAPLLRPGTNLIAVAAENKGGKPNAAGLVAALTVQLTDGREISIATDEQWLSTTSADHTWTREANAAGWIPVQDLGLFGIAPWEDVGKTASRIAPYPDSKQIEEVLREFGVLPDFEADARLGYAHRRVDQFDIYFVSNGSHDRVDTICTFRVANKTAELWHPETASRRELAELTSSSDGRTTVPLRFEPTESYFVVFRPHDLSIPAHPADRSKKAFPDYTVVATIEGSWDVSFDPRSGGPAEPVTFEQLTDWSQHSTDGIRYYSGTATYTKTIDIPAELLKRQRPLYLDLGRVEVVAAVQLNGADLGIAWKSPFHVALGEAAQPGINTLTVRVANLWPNRMIGDEHLPPDSDRDEGGTLLHWPQWMLENKTSPTGRYTLATWRHWNADSPRIPSGLLGPVTLLMEE